MGRAPLIADYPKFDNYAKHLHFTLAKILCFFGIKRPPPPQRKGNEWTGNERKGKGGTGKGAPAGIVF